MYCACAVCTRMCVHVDIHVCMYARVCACVLACVYCVLCVCVLACECMCVQCVHVCTRVCVLVCVYTTKLGLQCLSGLLVVPCVCSMRITLMGIFLSPKTTPRWLFGLGVRGPQPTPEGLGLSPSSTPSSSLLLIATGEMAQGPGSPAPTWLGIQGVNQQVELSFK